MQREQIQAELCKFWGSSNQSPLLRTFPPRPRCSSSSTSLTSALQGRDYYEPILWTRKLRLSNWPTVTQLDVTHNFWK